MKKKIDVEVSADAEMDNLKEWQSKDPASFNRVLQAGYIEGLDEGCLKGYAFSGLALLVAAGGCKLIKVITRSIRK